MIERYETEAMREIWSDRARLGRWTRIELAVCEAWHQRGAISATDIATLRAQCRAPTPERVAEIEKETDHDVVAFVRALGEPVDASARRHLHRGLTSSDVVDTALGMGLVEGLSVLATRAHDLENVLARRALEFRNTVCVGRTHGIHAEPTTFGLRLAGWLSEVRRMRARLLAVTEEAGYGKLSGAVGTFSQTDPEFEALALGLLNLKPESVATQVVPRDRHAAVLCQLALVGSALERFAIEIRHLQRTEVREVEEAFKAGQTGSSAMPHKRNPILSERITGIARLLRAYAHAALESTGLWHDRDISHSSVERVAIPDAFHLCDYALGRFTKLVDTLMVYPDHMTRNLNLTRGLVFSQTVLTRLIEAGCDRQVAYRHVQAAAMAVWADPEKSLLAELRTQPDITNYLTTEQLERCFDPQHLLRHTDALFRRLDIA